MNKYFHDKFNYNLLIVNKHTFAVTAFLAKDIRDIDWLSRHRDSRSTVPSDNSVKPVHEKCNFKSYILLYNEFKLVF